MDRGRRGTFVGFAFQAASKQALCNGVGEASEPAEITRYVEFISQMSGSTLYSKSLLITTR